MRRSSRVERDFWWLAVLCLATAGLLLGAYWPNVTGWHRSITDRLLHGAASSSGSTQLNWISAASKWAPYDSAVVQAERRYYQSNHQDQQAFQVLTRLYDPNPIYLGNQAVDLLQYGTAKGYFEQASRESVSAASTAGESAALINIGQVDAGCEKAHQAAKLDLASVQAASLVWYCDVYQRGGRGVPRSDATRMLQAKLFQPARSVLDGIDTKTAQDFLLLAQYDMAEGKTNRALELAHKAYDLDPDNVAVAQALHDYASLAGDDKLAAQLQPKLEIIQLKY